MRTKCHFSPSKCPKFETQEISNIDDQQRNESSDAKLVERVKWQPPGRAICCSDTACGPTAPLLSVYTCAPRDTQGQSPRNTLQ